MLLFQLLVGMLELEPTSVPLNPRLLLLSEPSEYIEPSLLEMLWSYDAGLLPELWVTLP